MTRLIFVRHGESEANLQRAFAGWTNAALTDKGHAQAEAAARYLLQYKIDVAYASDLQRARDTAKHIADKQGIPLVPDRELREIYAGEWEGRLFDDLIQEDAEAYTTWRQTIGLARPTGGESVAELQTRVQGAVNRILAAHTGKTVLIGTHATPIRVMECIWRDIPLAEAHTVPWRANASTTVVEYDESGRARIALCGYHEYLGDLLTGLPRTV